MAKYCRYYHVWCHDKFGISFRGQKAISNVLTCLELSRIVQVEVGTTLWSLCRLNHEISSNTKTNGNTNHSVKYWNLIFDFWFTTFGCGVMVKNKKSIQDPPSFFSVERSQCKVLARQKSQNFHHCEKRLLSLHTSIITQTVRWNIA